MSKASIQDLQDEGWTPDQFGVSAGADWTAYLQRVLDDASRWTSSFVGATTYDAQTDGDATAFGFLVSAEVQYADAVLFRRRIVLLDGNAVAGLQNAPKVDPLKALRLQADAALQTARDYLTRAMDTLGLDASTVLPGTGMSSGTLITGRYAEASCV